MDPDPKRAFGLRLRALRKNSEKTLNDLADVLGVSVVYVSDVERGNRQPLRSDLIERAAEFLGGQPAELHRLAAEAKGAFELPTQNMTPRGRDFVAGLARGERYDDDFWEEVMRLAEKSRREA